MPSTFSQWMRSGKAKRRRLFRLVGDYVVPAAVATGAAIGTYYAGKYAADSLGGAIQGIGAGVGNAIQGIGDGVTQAGAAAQDYYFNPDAQAVAQNLTPQQPDSAASEPATYSGNISTPYVPPTGIDDTPYASPALDLHPDMSGKSGYLPAAPAPLNASDTYDEEDLGGACLIS